MSSESSGPRLVCARRRRRFRCARLLGRGLRRHRVAGLAVDIAVPLAMSAWLAASRIASIRGGRIKLVEHEAQAGSRLCGHTIAEHVGQTEARLRARLLSMRSRLRTHSQTLGGTRSHRPENANSCESRWLGDASRDALSTKAGRRSPLGSQPGDKTTSLPSCLKAICPRGCPSLRARG